MIIRARLPSGIEVIGLPTENAYGGGWDLGPTWNYLVLSDPPFLVDAGRSGMGPVLVDMMAFVGLSVRDLGFVLLSHGHEDHDGAVPELAALSGTEVKAHRIYDRLIRFYPEHAPEGLRRNFPASCWRCFMPESFSATHCAKYHQERSRLRIDPISDGETSLVDGIRVRHLPGHSPDALTVLIGGEAAIVGDTLLPDITPWPSQEGFYAQVRGIIEDEYPEAHAVYGLRAYLRSLKKLMEIGEQAPDRTVFPAHRLYFGGRWNRLRLQDRAQELIQHHLSRCSAILDLLKDGPKTPKELALAHFEARLLKGLGILMAENEIVSHCEFLCAAGDVAETHDGRFMATGSARFEGFLQGL
jgi:glyoxylase-like metal-dependent hydrolase (beta-lactamase superfamily II)